MPMPADDAAAVLLTQLGATLDALLALPTQTLSDDGVLAAADGVETVRRRLPAVEHRVIVELECRGVAAKHLRRSTAALLAARLGIDPATARARVRAAQLLGPRTSITGDPLAPVLPATAAAQVTGTISEAHAAIIVRTVHAWPHTLDPDVVTRAEAFLAAEATHLNPGELTRHAELLTTYLDPDGTVTDDTDRARRRGLTLGAQGTDGMSAVHGLLDPTCRALLDAAISALARPNATHDATHDATEPTPERVPDPRTPDQRRHDALAAVCRAALAGGRLPGNRGLPASVVVTMTLAQLEAAMAAADAARTAGPDRRSATGDPNPWTNPDGATAATATGTRLPLPEALALAADARWSLTLFDHRGQPLFLGRDARLATAAQRLALTARDRGCTRPGCDLPPGYTQVHHLDEWAHGGSTDVDRMCLVCDYDHRLITDEGFTLTPRPDGRVAWTAPSHLDPTRTPHVNPLHHPPDLLDPDPPALSA